MTTLIRSVATLALCGALSAPAVAEDWFVRVGAHTVNPRSDNGSLADGALAVDIGSDTRPTLVLGRWLNDSWAVELLAAAPFKHEVRLNGAHLLDFKHLPPTLSLQYYFAPGSTLRPFIGAGINYTWTFDEDERGALDGSEVKIDNSWGAALQLGLDWQLADNWELVADLRWMDIDADVKLDGADIGSVQVDPRVYGLYLGYRF